MKNAGSPKSIRLSLQQDEGYKTSPVYHNVDSSCFCLSSGFVKEVNSHSQLVLYYIILYKWPEFYYDLVYKFKTIVHRADFSDQYRKIIVRYKRIGYNINIMRQSACLVCLT